MVDLLILIYAAKQLWKWRNKEQAPNVQAPATVIGQHEIPHAFFSRLGKLFLKLIIIS